MGSKPSPCDVAIQADILPAYVLDGGENMTGCFDIYKPSKSTEDYFIASNNVLQRLVATMAHYDGNCPLCGFALDLPSYSIVQHGHACISCMAGHSVTWYSGSTVGGKCTANLRSCSLHFVKVLTNIVFVLISCSACFMVINLIIQRECFQYSTVFCAYFCVKSSLQ